MPATLGLPVHAAGIAVRRSARRAAGLEWPTVPLEGGTTRVSQGLLRTPSISGPTASVTDLCVLCVFPKRRDDAAQREGQNDQNDQNDDLLQSRAETRRAHTFDFHTLHVLCVLCALCRCNAARRVMCPTGYRVSHCPEIGVCTTLYKGPKNVCIAEQWSESVTTADKQRNPGPASAQGMQRAEVVNSGWRTPHPCRWNPSAPGLASAVTEQPGRQVRPASHAHEIEAGVAASQTWHCGMHEGVC